MYNGLHKKVISLTGIRSKLKGGGEGSDLSKFLKSKKLKNKPPFVPIFKILIHEKGVVYLQWIVKLKSSFRFRMPLLWIKTLKAEI